MRLIHTFRPDTQEVCFTAVFSDVEWRDACSRMWEEDATVVETMLLHIRRTIPVSETLEALARMAESVEPTSPVAVQSPTPGPPQSGPPPASDAAPPCTPPETPGAPESPANDRDALSHSPKGIMGKQWHIVQAWSDDLCQWRDVSSPVTLIEARRLLKDRSQSGHSQCDIRIVERTERTVDVHLCPRISEISFHSHPSRPAPSSPADAGPLHAPECKPQAVPPASEGRGSP